MLAYAVASVFLLFAGVQDWRTREVSNKIWLLFFPTALAFFAFQFISEPVFLAWALTVSVVVSAASVALFYAGAFGGADAKALICLSVAAPFSLPLVASALLGFVAIDYFFFKRRNRGWTMPFVSYLAAASAIAFLAEACV
jgi:archaeal preflagellin peptidase FlaK